VELRRAQVGVHAGSQVTSFLDSGWPWSLAAVGWAGVSRLSFPASLPFLYVFTGFL
jgi:hypothetical protein